MSIVAKFGGTSLATREQMEKVMDIVLSNPERKVVVVSAPGDRFKGDTKLTELLITASKDYRQNGSDSNLDQISERITSLLPEKSALTSSLLSDLRHRLTETNRSNYEYNIKAFGEYASARIFTSLLEARGVNAVFLDPNNIGLTAIEKNGLVLPDPQSYSRIGKLLPSQAKGRIAVVPGFYAYTRRGKLVTFPRGGSDTTGAILSRGIEAEVYENWTDENGLRAADPKICPDSPVIKEITLEEARELAYNGFKLQFDSLRPLLDGRTMLNVRNTNNPTEPGTRIMQKRMAQGEERIIGIASKPGYMLLDIYKPGMNQEIGFGRDVLDILLSENINYEHNPTGYDSMSLIIERDQIQSGKLDRLLSGIKKKVKPEEITYRDKIAILAVVGLGMRSHPDVPGRTLSALAKENIHQLTLNKGATDLSMFIGIEENRRIDAVKAVYNEFFG
ncbi:MAG: aspartate kinase [archaeon]